MHIAPVERLRGQEVERQLRMIAPVERLIRMIAPVERLRGREVERQQGSAFCRSGDADVGVVALTSPHLVASQPLNLSTSQLSQASKSPAQNSKSLAQRSESPAQRSESPAQNSKRLP